MLNNKEKSDIITNGAETVKKKVIKMLEQANLSNDDLIKVIAKMASNEYAEAKCDNFRFSVESEINIIYNIVTEIVSNK